MAMKLPAQLLHRGHVKHIPSSFVIELVKESEVRTATKAVCGLKRLTQLRSSRPSRYVAVSCLSQLEIQRPFGFPVDAGRASSW